MRGLVDCNIHPLDYIYTYIYIPSTSTSLMPRYFSIWTDRTHGLVLVVHIVEVPPPALPSKSWATAPAPVLVVATCVVEKSKHKDQILLYLGREGPYWVGFLRSAPCKGASLIPRYFGIWEDKPFRRGVVICFRRGSVSRPPSSGRVGRRLPFSGCRDLFRRGRKSKNQILLCLARPAPCSGCHDLNRRRQRPHPPCSR